MTASIGATGRAERRAWATQAEHQAVLARLLDDGCTDRVTSFHNRRYLMEVLEPQIAISREYQFPMCVLVAEIAHFRQIRFTFGDAVADSILKDTACTIKSTVRATDLLVRYGDQSFALLLLHCNKFGAQRVCTRLKDKIARHTFDAGKSDLIVTVNFGATEQAPSYDDKGKDLLAYAEKALEKANATGGGALVVDGINS